MGAQLSAMRIFGRCGTGEPGDVEASYAMFGAFRLLGRRAGMAAPAAASDTIGAIDTRPFDASQLTTTPA
jgi:hypothetical protein